MNKPIPMTAAVTIDILNDLLAAEVGFAVAGREVVKGVDGEGLGASVVGFATGATVTSLGGMTGAVVTGPRIGAVVVTTGAATGAIEIGAVVTGATGAMVGATGVMEGAMVAGMPAEGAMVGLVVKATWIALMLPDKSP